MKLPRPKPIASTYRISKSKVKVLENLKTHNSKSPSPLITKQQTKQTAQVKSTPVDRY